MQYIVYNIDKFDYLKGTLHFIFHLCNLLRGQQMAHS